MLLVTVAIAAIGCLFLKQYLEWRVDYITPPMRERSVKRSITLTETEALRFGREKQIAKLKSEHPPRGWAYWQAQAAKVQPRMTDYALQKYLPRASGQGSYLIVNTNGPSTQVYYYAVDAEFAVLCEMTTELRQTESFERVVRMIGIFPHRLEVDDFGTLKLANFDVVNRMTPEKADGPIVTFGE